MSQLINSILAIESRRSCKDHKDIVRAKLVKEAKKYKKVMWCPCGICEEIVAGMFPLYERATPEETIKIRGGATND